MMTLLKEKTRISSLFELEETPNGLNIYIPYAGSYVIYFTLSNGDIYYGEFEVTD